MNENNINQEAEIHSESSPPEQQAQAAQEAAPATAAADAVEAVEGIKGAFIEVADDDDGAWHWCLWSGNGRPVARSGQTHETFKSCVQSLRSIVKLWAQKLPIVRSHKG